MATQDDNELPRLPPRRPDAHKGDFGVALIVSGSRGMAGAAAGTQPLMVIKCAPGCKNASVTLLVAGGVRLAVPDVLLDTVAGFEPSYMTAALPSDAAGRIGPGAFDRIVELAESATVLACGPGLGRSLDLDHLVLRLYREIAKPMVFDADALNALATEPVAGRHAARSARSTCRL